MPGLAFLSDSSAQHATRSASIGPDLFSDRLLAEPDRCRVHSASRYGRPGPRAEERAERHRRGRVMSDNLPILSTRERPGLCRALAADDRLLRGEPEHAPAPVVDRRGCPLISPSGDLGGEAPIAERGDDQAAPCVGSIRLGMARRADRHQAVEVEVRAPLGAQQRL